MSIQKNTSLSNGVSGNFWVTSRVYVSPQNRNGGVQATLDLYPSHDAWVTGAPAIDQRIYELSGNTNPLTFGQLVAVIEPYLIANQSDFVSGTIVH